MNRPRPLSVGAVMKTPRRPSRAGIAAWVLIGVACGGMAVRAAVWGGAPAEADLERVSGTARSVRPPGHKRSGRIVLATEDGERSPRPAVPLRGVRVGQRATGLIWRGDGLLPGEDLVTLTAGGEPVRTYGRFAAGVEHDRGVAVLLFTAGALVCVLLAGHDVLRRFGR